MDGELIPLVAACAAFVGTHFLLSNPLRKPMVRGLGERGFLLVYSLIAFAALTWIALAFHRASPAPALWDGTAAVPWIAASILTIAAMALLLAALNRNPALPMAQLAGLSARKPWGVFKVTRHPMMMAFALWSVSHILASPTARTIVLALAILLLALVGANCRTPASWPRTAASGGCGCSAPASGPIFASWATSARCGSWRCWSGLGSPRCTCGWRACRRESGAGWARD